LILRGYQITALTLLILLLQSKGHSQLPDYHVQLFDERDGIRTNVEHVIKDDLGFVWLSYSDRVQRYDGKQMQEFIIGDRINSILSDLKHKVWVTSRNHVHLYDNSSAGFRIIQVESTEKISIGQVFQLPGKEVWLLTNLGFYVFDPQQSKFIPVTDEKSKAKTPVNVRRFSASLFGNILFYSSRDTIWSHDMSSGEMKSLPVRSLLTLHALNEYQVLVSTWKNQSFLYDLMSQQIQPIHPMEYLHHLVDDFLAIRDVVNLGANHYLLATTKGVLEYNSTSGILSQKQFYFKGQPLLNGGNSEDMYMDSDHKVWSCSVNSLMVFDPFNEVIGQVRNTRMEDANGFNRDIRNFTADEKENLWMSTSNGITYWDLQQNILTSIFPVEGATDRMNHPSIRGIAYDGKNVIIGQTNRGIWLYDPVTKKYRSPMYEAGADGATTKRRLERDFVDQIRVLHNGNYFVAARDGAYLIEKGSYLVRQVVFPGSKENLNFSYEDKFHQIWIGTINSIHCLDSNLVFRFSVTDGIGSGTKRCLLQWDENEYVLGAKGLYGVTFSAGNITTRTLSHFFDDINVHSIFRDSTDRLWLATDLGLYRYTKATGLVETFDYFDNIQGDFFNGNSFYYNTGGMLFLGGTNGINYFHPDKIPARNDSLQVSLIKVSVSQDDTSYYNRSALLSLRPKQNSIEIEYIAPYYGNTKRIQYRYQLEGMNNTWNNVGTNSVVRFTSLPPGEYKFRIAASMNGIEWFESDESLLFNIALPFWKTWWFISLSILAIAAIVFFVVKQRIRFVRGQETERRQSEVQLITMNRDLAASQLTALRSQMNPHFIFNALNSVQRYILKGDVDQANKYLSKFSRLQRDVLDNSRHDFISLEKEIEILELYLQLEQLRFDDKFEYTITVGKDIDPTEIKIPPMILQPFIENAIWHGLMPRTGSKRVDIQFVLSTDELLSCRIYDNGIGRVASARLKNNHDNSTQHQSKGLSLVHERLHILEQLYQRTYQVDVVDKMDSSGGVEGTEVNLVLYVGH